MVELCQDSPALGFETSSPLCKIQPEIGGGVCQ